MSIQCLSLLLLISAANADVIGSSVCFPASIAVKEPHAALCRSMHLRGGDDEAVPAAASQIVAVPPNPKKVYVGNLPISVQDDALKEFLSKVGEVTSLSVKRFPNSDRCKGFAMAEYATEEQAKAAIEQLAGSSFMKRSVLVRADSGIDPAKIAASQAKRAAALARKAEAAARAATNGGAPVRQRRPPSMGHPQFWPKCPPGCRVYVGNIKFGTPWQDVRDHMAKAGHVEFGKIIKAPMTNMDGSISYVSRGFAIVQYRTPQDAEAAVTSLDQSILNGRSIYVRPDQGRRRKTDSNMGEEELANLQVSENQ
ncbi:hypothetical protein GUITHDRAFT_120952 [Guillardia theta CCMP2712]|uniref:RRM domain-containing protein n=1 Tax=Guillardia theta (strain CCMP2712) TaxID=905079 RepID=L1I9G0_GUITC|nr:hypothetical protein GUITHDRAFT_120952 [Guillardia theta CCMP2712]EKX32848.1 hypothetical protein GUITHDRAFT_120952 [Guillardia theta CCMP2712]|eukprot:XP_005819828.1 hypothetical protein GUITHDRAFT_120952 [Guillardia theta CCMP2712]